MENKYTKHNMKRSLFSVMFVGIILFSLFASGLIVHAEENNTVGSVFGFYPNNSLSINGYELSDIYETDVKTSFQFSDSFDVSYISELVLPSLSGIDYSNYSKIACITDNSKSKTYIVLGTSDCFFLTTNSSVFAVNRLITRGSDGVNNGDLIYLIYTNGIFENYVIPNYTYLKNNVDYSYCGYDFSYILFNSCICSNTELYGLKSSNIPSSWGNFNGQDYFEVFSAAHTDSFDYGENKDIVDSFYFNTNYIDEDISGGGSGSSVPEGSENNLFMQQASWKLMNNFPYGNGTRFTVGNVSFSGQLSDYAIQHPEEFQVCYYFEINTQLYYRVDDSVSFGFSEIFTASHKVNFSNALQVSAHFITKEGYKQSLTDFMSGSYGKVFGLNEIYEDAICDSQFFGKTVDNFYASDFNELCGNTFTDNIVTNLSDSTALNVCQFKYYNVSCNAYLEAVNKVSPTSNLHPRSGICTSVFNLVDGSTVSSTDDITYNNNPYYDNNDDDSNIVPVSDIPSTDVNATGGSGGSASSSSGGNSQIVTVNGDDSAKYLPTLISKLIPSSDGDGGLSEDFQRLSNSNGWLQYMSATFAFIPMDFWTNLNVYFVVYLGIIGVAFIIRIILDLL